MMKMLYPDEYLDSTYEIDYEDLYRKGFRGLLFDVDNTLVPHDAPADERAIRLFKRLHDIGFRTCLISNNKEPRVRNFARQVGTMYIFKAGKPKPKGYLRAAGRMKTSRDNTVFVGDQIFTDVLGANLAGMKTIMVKPIHPREEIQIVLKRYLEKIVLFFYLRRNRNNEGKDQNTVEK